MRPSPSAAFLPSHDCTLRRGFGGFQLYLRLRARPVRFRGDRAGWLNRSAPPRSVAMLASTSRNRRETLSRASPSINSCRPLVTLLRPFGARETIWLASFLLLTGRTINRLFLAPLRYRKPTRQPRWRRPTDNLPYISSVAVLRCSGNEKPKGFVAKSPRARKKNWRRRLNRVGRVAGATCLKSATGNSAGLLLSRPRLRPAKTRRAILVQQETANGQPSERRIQGQINIPTALFPCKTGPVQNRQRRETNDPAKRALRPKSRGKRNLPAEERRRELLDAALDIFSEKGMGITIQALADRVSVTQPLVHRYFRTRADLIAGIREKIQFAHWDPDWREVLTDRSRPLCERIPRFLRPLSPAYLQRALVSQLLVRGAERSDLRSGISRARARGAAAFDHWRSALQIRLSRPRMPAGGTARDRAGLGLAFHHRLSWDTPLCLSYVGVAGRADDGARPDASLSSHRPAGDGGTDAFSAGEARGCAVRPPSIGARASDHERGFGHPRNKHRARFPPASEAADRM